MLLIFVFGELDEIGIPIKEHSFKVFLVFVKPPASIKKQCRQKTSLPFPFAMTQFALYISIGVKLESSVNYPQAKDLWASGFAGNRS